MSTGKTIALIKGLGGGSGSSGGASLPAAAPYQQLVTDGEGRLPSWTEQPGLAHYSGFMAYETELPLSAPAALDLGACSGITRAFADGQALGLHMWGPHTYALPAGMKKLRIEICNTPANAREHAVLPSGMLGPVTLTR